MRLKDGLLIKCQLHTYQSSEAFQCSLFLTTFCFYCLSISRWYRMKWQTRNTTPRKCSEDRKLQHNSLTRGIHLAVYGMFFNTAFLSTLRDQNNVYTQSVLAIHEHFKLFVIELCFLLWDEGTFSTLAHRVHKAHARQRHFFAAAFVTEALPTSSAVMLSVRECFIRLRNKWLGNNVVKFLH